MKKLLITVIIAAAVSGCSKSEEIKFCEGVDTEGKGVNCGKVFTTGDLTAVISSKAPFEADSITVNIRRVDGDRKKDEKTMQVETGREKKSANTTLQFYNAGIYIVEAALAENKKAEGTVEIRDTY